jgi:hypothetical protein
MSRLSRAADSLAVWLLCSGFPVLRRAPRGRLARARVLAYGFPVSDVLSGRSFPASCWLFGPVAMVFVPVAAWGRLGVWLADWCFRR